MKKSKFGKILAKEITERYCYFDFSVEHYLQTCTEKEGYRYPKNQMT